MNMLHNVKAGIKISVPAVMAFVVAAHLVRAMLETWLGKEGWDAGLAKDVSYFAVPTLLLLFMAPFFRMCKGHLQALLRPSACTLDLVLVAMCIGIAMRVAYWATIVTFAALGFVRDDAVAALVGAPVLELLRPATSVVVLSFLVMAVLTPATEEIINRGIILHALMQRGAVVAVLVSAALFAVMHSPHTYIMSFLGGIVLAAQALKFRTLWAPFLTHATFNGIVIVEQEFLYFVWHPGYPDLWLAIFALVTATIAIVIILASLLPTRGAQPGL
jgi:membrane protease YdiL (CAAX protease family)